LGNNRVVPFGTEIVIKHISLGTVKGNKFTNGFLLRKRRDALADQSTFRFNAQVDHAEELG
jgi:hypothetical protein